VLKIGDFSKLSLVSVKTLRYYDEIGLLKPAQVDEWSGYRYYSASQMPRLNRILALKDLGMSLEQIARLLDEGLPAEQIRGMLRFQLAEIEQRVQDDKGRMVRVEARLKHIEREGKLPVYEVILKKLPAQNVAQVRRVLPNYGCLGQLFGELFGYLGPSGTPPAGPPWAIYHDPEFKDRDVDIEVAVPVSGKIDGPGSVRTRELACGDFACAIHQGPYESIGEAYNTVMAWVEPNGYRLNGPVRECYVHGPAETQNPAEYVTEIQAPVAKG
jgi:effector-binding domain-containing protein